MIGPSIEPAEVGATGLLWLFLSYGYVLYAASNLISEGSELLLLVPSMAGLVGGVVLPFLGAVPDGAIILFSGLGDIEKAQETLSVGVGALAGSTIMLLTISFGLSVIAGRVNLRNGHPNYFGNPKLTPKLTFRDDLEQTGVVISEQIKHGGIIMVLTTIPYALIQIPALFMAGDDRAQVAMKEHWWAMSAVVICIVGLVVYMRLQLKASKAGEDRGKRMAVTKKLLRQGLVSLSGAVAARIDEAESKLMAQAHTEFQSLRDSDHVKSKGGVLYPPPSVANYLKALLVDAFRSYDENNNNQLDRRECMVFFKDFHESISENEMNGLFAKYDTDSSGMISFDEFIGLSYAIIKTQQSNGPQSSRTLGKVDSVSRNRNRRVSETIIGEHLGAATRNNGPNEDEEEDGEEEEDIPEEFTTLSPDEQQAAIKKRAFIMLALGTAMVVLFSDPMVDVMQEIAVRCHLPPFYVSFILAPLASNASEVIASMYYAKKKTSKTITVALSALQGAACMNNTLCLCIFMFLIFFRGLAWQYTAETIAIVAVQLVIGYMTTKSTTLKMRSALIALSLFPLSIIFVAVLEAFGFD